MTAMIICAVLGAALPAELVLAVSVIVSVAVLMADHEERRRIQARRRGWPLRGWGHV